MDEVRCDCDGVCMICLLPCPNCAAVWHKPAHARPALPITVAANGSFFPYGSGQPAARAAPAAPGLKLGSGGMARAVPAAPAGKDLGSGDKARVVLAAPIGKGLGSGEDKARAVTAAPGKELASGAVTAGQGDGLAAVRAIVYDKTLSREEKDRRLDKLLGGSTTHDDDKKATGEGHQETEKHKGDGNKGKQVVQIKIEEHKGDGNKGKEVVQIKISSTGKEDVPIKISFPGEADKQIKISSPGVVASASDGAEKINKSQKEVQGNGRQEPQKRKADTDNADGPANKKMASSAGVDEVH